MSDPVQNYYEPMVFNELTRQLDRKSFEINENQYSDMCCIALNNLPPRYVRFAIDTTFYATPNDLQAMEDKVEIAVRQAINFILEESAVT